MEQIKTQMEYRYLGNSGLKVSCLGYGTWLTSTPSDIEAKTKEVIKRCWELGINYFDTAEVYKEGLAETILGNSIKYLSIHKYIEY